MPRGRGYGTGKRNKGAKVKIKKPRKPPEIVPKKRKRPPKKRGR